MEKSNINIFENFAVTSVILPYFSYTHRMFLLLSSLCVGSRNKLDEFYEEFRNVMRKYCMKLDTIKNPKALKLPCDLFKFTISVKNQTDLNNFIEFIINISERRLNFFHNHFIHEKIFVFNTTIDFNLVEQLYPYIETMKSVEVCFSNKYRFGKHEEDTIYPYNDKDSGFDFSCFFSDEKCEQINPLFDSFRKIDFVTIRASTSNANKAQMELIGKAALKPKLFISDCLQEQDLENFLDPEFLKQGFDQFYYEPIEYIKFSNKMIENLKLLKPKEILFSDLECTEEKLKTVYYNTLQNCRSNKLNFGIFNLVTI